MGMLGRCVVGLMASLEEQQGGRTPMVNKLIDEGIIEVFVLEQTESHRIGGRWWRWPDELLGLLFDGCKQIARAEKLVDEGGRIGGRWWRQGKG
ncbi:hypothetical protein QJS10_CPB14g00898 [Acorus calamus]|uniref:Uncharacterized protein n=1 Tax=Acorus calamus TaxID=4465 RepID=A0AAV9DEI1_ACOCL|nr:hypothetical protein QJS10_CPB14g00898 [Acorus calamus]